MAHGYLEALSQGKEILVKSAGVETHGLNPLAVKYMMEDGVDISHHTSNHVDEYQDIGFDYVITVCDHANEVCPIFPSSATKIHKNFTDPSKVKGSEEEIASSFRKTRNAIKEFCIEFLKKV